MNRYESTKKIKDARKVVEKYETTTYPKFDRHEEDIYIITRKLERLDLLATRYYGDSRWWWIIVLANNLGKGTLVIKPGVQIRIPKDPMDIYDDIEQARQNR